MTSTVPESTDHHGSPEFRTIFADSPTLVHNSALGDGNPELLLGFSIADVFLRIETRRMSSDNLFRSISFDSLRPKIPAGDVPIGSQHENCIVFHAFNQ